ncbi:putative Diphosphomevalonate decarboxylase [Glarea lozoyensis 74030]|uniref:Diphosphomevalonate decarboxylase n=1 Tax=Glarea lozoyensis (strain ATCC 74030 / MF5533) TaxID=1104152 RepID=H0EQR2_GLAL7|nr:putative Diphosphomevalonate decarboxylase [Glarea lozoyensis 74030]
MAGQEIYQASTTAPVNIAVVKYWGKRDPKLNLPTNSSISVTLSQSDLRTHTTAACSSKFPSEDTLLLNSSPQDTSGARTQACFRELRSLRSALEASDFSLPKISSLPLRIVSENNFPTAAGLAIEVAPASHWPTMRALILVVSAEKKGVSSTSEVVVPKHMSEMEEAIKAKDFEKFGKVTMMESNSFHSVCSDTFPPIFYLNDVSKAAIRVVEDINKKAGKIIAAYTFDAGPNAVIYYEEENTAAVAGVVKGALEGLDGWQSREIESQDAGNLDARAVQVLKDGVSRVILTQVGEGPISTKDSLLAADGEALKK